MHFRNIFIAKILATVVFFCFFATGHVFAQWDKDVFSFRGRKALQEGKYATAIENFNILAKLDTSDYWNYFFRGIAKYNLGDLRGAQTDFNTSVRINPVFTNGYHYRAITYSRFGKYEQAFDDYNMALSLRPGSTEIYYSRGVTYFVCQQFDKAVSDFNRFIRKVPKDPSAYLNRGASYLFLGDTLAALNDYNYAIKLNRFEPEGYIRRGRLLAGQGKIDEAVSDMDKAVEMDPENSFALFNRALMLFELRRYNDAMADLNKVLEMEPGNALTLYNRGLIKAQLGDTAGALADLDRVANINPNNVLVYFNRAAVFVEMGRYKSALADYDRAIKLYPDFAKAYMNRSYVKSKLGMSKSAKEDYSTAQRKVREYKAKNLANANSFADTTKKYSSLIALDADFAKKDFNDEMLQHRDIDVKLRPFYKFVAKTNTTGSPSFGSRYENALLDKFIGTSPVPISISNSDEIRADATQTRSFLDVKDARSAFLQALYQCEAKQFNAALVSYDRAVSKADESAVEQLYKAFYLMNRGVLKAEMIDFIASIENNSQMLSLDGNGNTRATVKNRISQNYDYSEALADLQAADALAPTVAYIAYNLGNLYCLSGDHAKSVKAYTKAIKAHPYLGDAYFNRALVQLYLRDKEKGCNDLSVAGELGVKDAYSIIKKYCERE